MIRNILIQIKTRIFFIIIALSVCAYGEEIITSAAEVDYPPFSMVDPDGNAYGFSVELLESALAAMNTDVTFKTDIWAKVKKMLETGEVQALPLVGRTPEREKMFDFTFPYMSLHGAIVVRDGTENITELNDLKGRKVAVMAGDNAEEFLRRETQGINIITTPTFQEALYELSAGIYDAVVILKLTALRLIQDTGIDNLRIINSQIENFRQDFCFAVKKGDSRVLSLLNEGLSIVMADGTYRYLHSKWFAALELPSDRRIIIGGDQNFPPFEFVDKNGLPAGFNVDLSRAIAKELGIDIEIRLGPWTEVLEKLEKGSIDAVQGMFYSPSRDLKFDFSQPHTLIHNISVVRKGEENPPESARDLKGKSIVVQKGDIMHDFAVSNNLEITDLESQEEVLSALSKGDFDVALTARLSAIDLIKKHGWKNLVISRKPLLVSEYSYAVLNNRKPLLSEFSEGLKIIEESGEYRQIYEKWMGIYEKDDFSVIIRHIAIGALPVLAALLAALAWTLTLRKQVAKRTSELRKSGEQFRSLIEGASDAVYVQTDYRFSYINKSACRLFGASDYRELIGQPVAERFHPSERESVLHRIQVLNEKKESVPLVEKIILNLDGKEIPVEVSAVPVNYKGSDGSLAFMRDITERREAEKVRISLENQLAQSQKMESIGRLAGGVAHDYNNMLSVIIGYTELAMDSVDPEDQLYSDLMEIHQATLRSAEITRQLLAFARKQPITPAVLDLNRTVDNMLKTLRRLIGEDIDLAWFPGTDLWKIKMDSSQVDQILINLCINSRDAISGVGKLVIETKNVVTDRDPGGEDKSITPGEFILLEVSDDGSGMDKETRSLIFEPFFTTKSAGTGTGLGLATVYGIVKQNNGIINVYSEPGEGTSFKIYIPRYYGDEEISVKEKQATIQVSTGETVLVVEDETAIINMISKMLIKLGYKFFSASSPAEALTLAGKYKGKIDILITDVIMPEMNGLELSGKMQNIYPGIKTLFMSGYTADVIAHRGILEKGVCFIQKPFSLDDLAVKIREALE